MPFNVLEAPWIPVLSKNNKRELLSIRETLSRAPELREISDASPLEEFSCIRFLCVFLMDALRPETIYDIKAMLKTGCFDMEKIERYISLCQEEGVTFDLFDKERPFLQTAFSKEWKKSAIPKSITNIDCVMPQGNAHVHFEHAGENQSVSAAKAVRLLLTIQQFCVSMKNGPGHQYPSGVSGAPPYFSIVQGDSLFETLVHTLMPIEDIQIPFDTPPVIWRETEEIIREQRVTETSWLRGMFFPARQIQLIPTKSSTIEMIWLAEGENFCNPDFWTDPFVTYRTLKDNDRTPLRPNSDKPIWRSFYNIVDIAGNHAPQVLSLYNRITSKPYAQVTMYGVQTDNAKYLDVLRHDLQFSCTITENPDAVHFLKNAVLDAEMLARQLRSSIISDHIAPKSVAENAIARFYTKVESDFWQLCEDCTKTEELVVARMHWCDMIGKHAMNAYQTAMQSINLRGKTLALAGRQQLWLARAIKKIKEGSDTNE